MRKPLITDRILDVFTWICWKAENHCYGGLDFKDIHEYRVFKMAEWRQKDSLFCPHNINDEEKRNDEENY